LIGARVGWEAPWAVNLEGAAFNVAPGVAEIRPLWEAVPMLHGLAVGGLCGFVIGAALGWPLGWLSHRFLAIFFRLFNGSFDLSTSGYTRTVGLMLRGSLIVLLLYGGLLYLTYYSFNHTPTGFIPQQDKGYLLVNVQLPDASSVERTDGVMR